MHPPNPIRTHTHGTHGPLVITLHGGPGAPGTITPVARALADTFTVLEPFQRGSGTRPLTVAQHIADLHHLIHTRATATPPALVGESWGAMLALAYAAEHPHNTGPVVLIGCGTFDTTARARYQATLNHRMDPTTRQRIERLDADFPDPAARLQAMVKLITPLYDYNPIPDDPDPNTPPFDERAHRETWDDMLRLQAQGTYPAAFAAIRTPVLMLHGDHDPHPGPLIRDGLLPHIPHLQYHQLPHCGHSPWREHTARRPFLAHLRHWLTQHLAPAPPPA